MSGLSGLEVYYLCWFFMRDARLAVLDCKQVASLDDPAISELVLAHQNANFKVYELNIAIDGAQVIERDVIVRHPPMKKDSGKLLGTGPLEIVVP